MPRDNETGLKESMKEPEGYLSSEYLVHCDALRESSLKIHSDDDKHTFICDETSYN
jgi:hypothetical protein